MKKLNITLALMIIMLLVVSCGGYKATENADDDGYYKSFVDAKEAVAEYDMPIVIDFYTDWCHWCKKLDSDVYADDSVKTFFTTEMVLAKVNAEVDSALAKEFHISSYPTIVLTDSKGNEIDRISGYLPKDAFVKTLKGYMNGIGTLDALLAKTETNTDRSLYLEIAEKYKYRGGSDEARNWYNKVIEAGEPNDSVSAQSRFAIADMVRRSGDYENALVEFDKIKKDFIGTVHEEDAAIWKGLVYKQKGDSTTAVKVFEEFLKDYPKSSGRKYVEDQLKQLNGKLGS